MLQKKIREEKDRKVGINPEHTQLPKEFSEDIKKSNRILVPS